MRHKSTFRSRTPFTVDVLVQGIPAQAKVTYYYSQGPDLSADNPFDYHGGYEVEFELLDRKGYPAEWLERKVDDKTRNEIEDQIIEYMEDI